MSVDALRSALERALKIIDNPHYHDSCGSRPADHPAVDELREVLAASDPAVAYPDQLGIKLVDDLIKIADASMREDGTDIPLGKQLRRAAQVITVQRRALVEIYDVTSAAYDDEPMSHVHGCAKNALAFSDSFLQHAF